MRPGQMRAALALGMGRWQAIRTIIPAAGLVPCCRRSGPHGDLGEDSAVASVVAVPELIRQTQVLVSNTYLSFQLYSFTMIVFFLICYPIARGIDRFYKRVGASGEHHDF